MPIYEFVCDECKEEKEKIVKTADTEVKCEKCGKPMHKKFPTGTNFKLMGTGWYGRN
jgi:putative FmdB family regulatory protein